MKDFLYVFNQIIIVWVRKEWEKLVNPDYVKKKLRWLSAAFRWVSAGVINVHFDFGQ